MSTGRRNPPMPATQMRQHATDQTAARDLAIDAAARCLYERAGTGADAGLDPLTSIERHPLWEKLGEGEREVWRDHARAAQRALAGPSARRRPMPRTGGGTVMTSEDEKAVTLPARDVAQLRRLINAIQPGASDAAVRSAAFALAGYLDAALSSGEARTNEDGGTGDE